MSNLQSTAKYTPPPRMTDSEFSQKESELLSKIPKEFRSATSCLAYERGHAYGNEEIISNLEDLVDFLLTPIANFEKRLLGK